MSADSVQTPQAEHATVEVGVCTCCGTVVDEHLADDRHEYELLQHLDIEHSIGGDDVYALRSASLAELEARHVAEHDDAT